MRFTLTRDYRGVILNGKEKGQAMKQNNYVRANLRKQAETRSVSEMAEHHGVSRGTIYRWLAREGLTAVSGHRRSNPPLEDILRMRDEEELTLEEIGYRYGVSRQRVHQWIQRESETNA